MKTSTQIEEEFTRIYKKFYSRYNITVSYVKKDEMVSCSFGIMWKCFNEYFLCNEIYSDNLKDLKVLVTRR